MQGLSSLRQIYIGAEMSRPDLKDDEFRLANDTMILLAIAEIRDIQPPVLDPISTRRCMFNKLGLKFRPVSLQEAIDQRVSN